MLGSSLCEACKATLGPRSSGRPTMQMALSIALVCWALALGPSSGFSTTAYALPLVPEPCWKADCVTFCEGHNYPLYEILLYAFLLLKRGLGYLVEWKDGRGDRIRTYEPRDPKSYKLEICSTMLWLLPIKYWLISPIRNMLHTQSLMSVSCRFHINWACSSSNALSIFSSALCI